MCKLSFKHESIFLVPHQSFRRYTSFGKYKVTRQAELIFGDLKATYSELDGERFSPVVVRRSFGRFIDLSQKLTSAMRRDFSTEKNKKWEASDFNGWNEVTVFFKKLRNFDQHEFPIQIQVHQRNYFSIEEGSDQHLVVEGTWSLGSPFSKEPPEGMALVLGDPKTGKPTDTKVEPSRIEFEFVIHAQNEALENKLEKIGTKDIHALSRQCFEVLSNYYDYFCASINKV